MEVQMQIRRNAREVADYMESLRDWTKDISVKDEALRSTAPRKPTHAVPVRGGLTVKAAPSPAALPVPESELAAAPDDSGSAADHTYDRGYARWESMDVDAMLDAVDEEEAKPAAAAAPAKKGGRKSRKKKKRVVEAAAAESKDTAVSLEEEMRQEGNKHFRRGEFAAAVKSYTRCIGLNPNNHLALSNRAQAYLKLKQWTKAEADCTAALSVDRMHGKSWSRRAAARNAQGKHKAALQDLLTSRAIKRSKAVDAELRKTRELIRSSARKAPRVSVAVKTLAGPIGTPLRDAHPLRLVDDSLLDSSLLAAEERAAAAEEAEGAVRLPIASSSVSKMARVSPFGGKAGEAGEESKKKVGGKTAAVAASSDSGSSRIEEMDLGPPKNPTADPSMLADLVTPVIPSSPPSSPSAAATAVSPTATSESSAAAAPAAAAAAAAASRPVKVAVEKKLPGKTPKTNYEFNRVWRSLRGEQALQAQYLRRLTAKSKRFARVFKGGMEADMMLQLLRIAGEHWLPADGAAVLKLALAMSATPRFGMTIGFLSTADKQAVADVLAAASAAGGDADAVARARSAFDL
eukprot:PLAT3317.34.p2 GENE.PLAT3317.34~~PLAT3317.34.p2  ORF type:complete len:585 (-),score=233.52 PLAT3317.34:43-1770(-)